MKDSKVAWCHHTINFWLGCDEVSKECAGCYARAQMEQKKQHFHILRLTQTWRSAYALNTEAERQGKCAFIFASSMTDFWHPDADRWRPDAWDVIRECKNIVWLLLTKRPERIERQIPSDWESNFGHCWLGTTVGMKSSTYRADILRTIPGTKRFLSVEPMLEDISNELDLTGIGWILVGGMSGWKSQTMGMDIRWAANLYDKTRSTETKFFWKQVSALRPEQGSNALGLFLASRDGVQADPENVNLIREIPETQLPLMPLDTEKGHRFTSKRWLEYQSHMARLPLSPNRN